MTLTAIATEPTPTRAFETAYTAVVFDDQTAVLDESYPTAAARQTAIIDLLLANHDEIASQDVVEVLAPFGGADADTALKRVFALYSNMGVAIDAHLAEHQRDVGPAVLYSSFTDYGDGITVAEHYGTREERLVELRQRASMLADDYELEFFQTADETICKQLIEYALRPTQGRLYLFEAKRQDVGGVYLSKS